MPATALDWGAFTQAEKVATLNAAKAEVLTRMTGRVQNGSSAAQSFGMSMMSFDQLTALVNGLTVELGYPQPETRVAPNFSGVAGWGFGPCAAAGGSNSRIEPDVHTWADLAALYTTGYQTNTIKIWVEAATGVTHTVRLLEGTDETDTASGIQRPNDYSNPGNARVWYEAAP